MVEELGKRKEKKSLLKISRIDVTLLKILSVVGSYCHSITFFSNDKEVCSFWP